MDNMRTLSKDDLENMQISKETEYVLNLENLTTVELQDLELAKKVAELQLERKNLGIAFIQGKHNLRRISSELRNIKTCIYRRLREE